MDARPSYLVGRGRGRGRGIANRTQEPTRWDDGPPGHRRQDDHNNGIGRHGDQSDKLTPMKQHNDSTKQTSTECAESKFKDAASQHKASAQKHLDHYDDPEYSSSDDEEINDNDIIDSLYKSFKQSSGVESLGLLGKTRDYLMTTVKAKANVCLICIETIKKNVPIWSCTGCFCMFHISCIQKWVKDGIYQQTCNSNDDRQTVPWNCPKCRHEYRQVDCPSRYFCFCGKEEDPVFDPWLVPHSCGQVCGQRLKPLCGHSCLLLCHPGPCPPCPQTVQVSCYCEKQAPQIRRCGTKEWSCSQPCGNELNCGHHVCQTACHAGPCPPCPESSEQRCQCGRESTIRQCANPEWQCQQICGSFLECGHHTCELCCHPGGCPPCPRSGNRSCPCGKTKFNLPCTEDSPTCLDSCDKSLPCQKHQCNQRCHFGPCGTCREMTTKVCRCGKKNKELQCFKEYLCDVKCSNMKDCRKHPCKRKCCDGNCPPCDMHCGKPLGCKNHKCLSRCHPGQCYPCPLTIPISCNCGATSITVPCGRERLTKPPRCRENCKKKPECHHKTQLAHRCHFGRCPPCRQTCNDDLPCSHTCPAICHTAVLVKVKERVERIGPWEPAPEAKLETVAKRCPPCAVLVPVTCLGGHETVNLPCSESKVTSCHRLCGRLLSCGNHVCKLECHKIEGTMDDQLAGENCQVCEDPCSKPRPDGCTHTCLLPCHPDVCPPCSQHVRMRCHCQLVIRHIECDQWTHAEDKERERLQSCRSKCPRNLPCGHQCKTICHPGDCPNPDRCTEKMKVRCVCRRKKRDFLCNEVQAGYGVVECDDVCHQAKERQNKQKEEEEKNRIENEAKRQQEELEEFERKLRGRKRRPRKQRVEEEEPRFLQKYGKFIIAPILVVLLSMFVYFLLNK